MIRIFLTFFCKQNAFFGEEEKLSQVMIVESHAVYPQNVVRYEVRITFSNRWLDKNEIAFIEDGTFAKVKRFSIL